VSALVYRIGTRGGNAIRREDWQSRRHVAAVGIPYARPFRFGTGTHWFDPTIALIDDAHKVKAPDKGKTVGIRPAVPVKPPIAAAPAATHEVVASGADLTYLVAHATLLSPEVVGQINKLPLPAKKAQVLRLISFQGDQMVGGYTIIFTG
jgi:hypothetical protein